jgi:16S rRNA (cytosine967-C5)-methyltransferase
MKLHRTLVLAVAETLRNIFREGMYADKAVEQALKSNVRFGSRDRKFIAENVYGMVRWWRLITAAAGDDEDLLRLFAVWMIIRQQELPDWQEFSEVDKAAVLSRYAELVNIRKFRESVPDWLEETGSMELGDEVWSRELHALNEEAKVVLRVNSLKTDPAKLQRMLTEQQIETTVIPGYEDALALSRRQNLHQLNEYRNGLFEIQDASSQLIAPFMELEQSMTVIDACAGAGGKSLHMAAMMQNKGKIISMDVEERKLLELKKRADRGGVKIIETKTIASQVLDKLENTADRLLLDVPCSGLGVLRRNPDAKWKLSPEFISGIRKTQQEIISNYSRMLRSGGIMVYATCSILPSENQKQVEKFLEKEKEFEFISDRKIMPSEGFDGFYMAKLRRK